MRNKKFSLTLCILACCLLVLLLSGCLPWAMFVKEPEPDERYEDSANDDASTEQVSEADADRTRTSSPAEMPSFNMIQVPAGEYIVPVGRLKTSAGGGLETEFAEVSGGFLIGETEVTFELWYAVRQWAQENGYDITPGLEGSKGVAHQPPTEASQEPVTLISWRNAVIWCNALSEMEGKKPLYLSPAGDVLRNREDGEVVDAAVQAEGDGYRLPTLEEWHLAARYIDGESWTPCDHVSGSDVPVKERDESGAATLCEESAEYAVYMKWGFGGQTEPVKSRKPNALGIYDMSGNVAECTFSVYRGNNYFLLGGHYSYDGFMIQLGKNQTINSTCGEVFTGLRIVRDDN